MISPAVQRDPAPPSAVYRCPQNQRRRLSRPSPSVSSIVRKVLVAPDYNLSVRITYRPHPPSSGVQRRRQQSAVTRARMAAVAPEHYHHLLSVQPEQSTVWSTVQDCPRLSTTHTTRAALSSARARKIFFEMFSLVRKTGRRRRRRTEDGGRCFRLLDRGESSILASVS